ncbi:hypothetical protein ACQ4PT_052104 [Festuca glaucescens]
MVNLSTSYAVVLFSNADPSSSNAQPATLAALADMLASHQAAQAAIPLSVVLLPSSAPAGSVAAAAAPKAPARAAPCQNLRHVIIKQQVQVTLDLQRPTFTMWRRMFSLTLGQFGVLDHIDGDTNPHHDDLEWVQDDFTIVSWLYTTVSEEILLLILTPDDTAIAVWRRMENLFLDNAVTRAVYLDDEFHSQRQGNMTVSAYCSRLKSLVDRLRDFGRRVTDADLVHRVLTGLHSEFRHAVTTLSREVPLPSFQDVRSFLVLEQSRNHDDDTTPAGTALHAHAPGHCSHRAWRCLRHPRDASTTCNGPCTSSTSAIATVSTEQAQDWWWLELEWQEQGRRHHYYYQASGSRVLAPLDWHGPGVALPVAPPLPR